MISEIQYCARCLYPSTHPLGLTFDADGVCSGCRVHEEKDELDWSSRFRRLEALVELYRSRSGQRYDCIVPVSGGRDSYFIVDVVVNRLGLNPLLVSYNRHYNSAIGHRNLAYLRTIFDCDYVQYTLSPVVAKALTHSTLEKLGSFHWQVLAGETVWPVRCAVQYRTPLIIWGAHQGVDQVGMFSHLDEVEMSRWYRKNHDLMGLEAEDLVDEARGLPERDLLPLFYPDDRHLAAIGVRGIYLNNYIRWDSKAQHEDMIARHGYETGDLDRTFDRYNDVHCVHYAGLHDQVKMAKHGYGKARDHACRELRLKRLDRGSAQRLVQRYEHADASDGQALFDWLEISESEFWNRIDRHRNPRVWQRRGKEWQRAGHPESPTIETVARVALDVIEPMDFSSGTPRSEDDEKYRLFARGFVDSEYGEETV
ncbi:MAG: N-acetyl sugar amidotransferase [Alphaproteobacteria bacterium]|nr:N-acetyl sugar amidotransferase [Alphaproteobacteria bacterium]